MSKTQRIPIQPIEGLSAYRLSKIVKKLNFDKPSLNRQRKNGGIKKAVLRSLCDNYPNVFPSVGTIAADTGFGTTNVKIALRELEHEDRLIVGISSKKGGRKNTVQYFIHDRAIMDIYNQQRMWEASEKGKNSYKDSLNVTRHLKEEKPDTLRTETRHFKGGKPDTLSDNSTQNPTRCVEEEIRVEENNEEEEKEITVDSSSSNIQHHFQCPAKEGRLCDCNAEEKVLAALRWGSVQLPDLTPVVEAIREHRAEGSLSDYTGSPSQVRQVAAKVLVYDVESFLAALRNYVGRTDNEWLESRSFPWSRFINRDPEKSMFDECWVAAQKERGQEARAALAEAETQETLDRQAKIEQDSNDRQTRKWVQSFCNYVGWKIDWSSPEHQTFARIIVPAWRECISQGRIKPDITPAPAH